MKVLETPKDRWRSVKCSSCSAKLEVEDSDVEVERFWDGEDGCYDTRTFVVCVVCSKRFQIDCVPTEIKDRRLGEREARDLETLGRETVAVGRELTIHRNECGWSINVMNHHRAEVKNFGVGHGDTIADALLDLAKKMKAHAAS